MRISVDLFDPGYANFRAWGHRARIFFQGSERNNIVTADEEGRFVIAHVLDANGAIKRDKNDQPMRETLFGDVCIKLPEDEAAYGSVDWGIC